MSTKKRYWCAEDTSSDESDHEDDSKYLCLTSVNAITENADYDFTGCFDTRPVCCPSVPVCCPPISTEEDSIAPEPVLEAEVSIQPEVSVEPEAVAPESVALAFFQATTSEPSTTLGWLGDSIGERQRRRYRAIVQPPPAPTEVYVSEEPDLPPEPPPEPPPPPPPPIDPYLWWQNPLPPAFERTQYTPNFTNVTPTTVTAGCIGKEFGAAAIDDASARGRAVSGGTMGHSPDLITWFNPRWNLANGTDSTKDYRWNGVPLDITGMSGTQVRTWLFPGRYNMRGLREHYYSFDPPPFADPYYPTVGEVDNWNIEVIRHFRRLIGNTTPLSPNRCLFLRAHWNTERKYSTYWDAAYPGTYDSAYGPCFNNGVLGPNGHCGASFIPSAEDQVPYLEGGGSCSSTGGSEGVRNIKKDLAWSIRMSEIIYLWLGEDGLGGHTGPFRQRTQAGFSFHCWDSTWLVFRGKWSG